MEVGYSGGKTGFALCRAGLAGHRQDWEEPARTLMPERRLSRVCS